MGMKVRMKRLMRSLVSGMAVICLLMANSMVLNAAEEKAFHQENYEAAQGEIILYVNKTGDSELLAENIEVKLDNHILPIKDISNFNTEVDPITYYCLVDVSGSLDSARMETIKTMLGQVIAGMKDVDNMAVATIADEHMVSDYLADKDELTALVSQIAVTKQDTNLYFAISEALKSLEQNADVHTKRCLLIFSDGADEQDTGITKDEVIKAIEASDIPVFTVAMISQKKTAAQLEAAKVLGSFARTSIGGVHYAPLLEDYEYEAVTDMIKEEINSSYKLCCEIKDIELKENTCVLQTTWKLEDGTDVIDQKEIPADRIRDYVEITPPPVAEEPVVVETIVEESVEEPSAEEIVEEQGGISFVVLMAVFAIIVIVVIVLVVMSNKKKKEEEARQQQEMMARAEAERLQAERERAQKERQRVLEQARAAAPPQAPTPAPTPPPKLPDITLKLIKLGTKKDEIIHLPICKECKFGRSEEKCDYAIPEDKSLSSLHCTFIYRNKKVYLRDEKSTNGSFINGIPLEGEHELLQDDVIYVGSYKYRVMW